MFYVRAEIKHENGPTLVCCAFSLRFRRSRSVRPPPSLGKFMNPDPYAKRESVPRRLTWLRGFDLKRICSCILYNMQIFKRQEEYNPKRICLSIYNSVYPQLCTYHSAKCERGELYIYVCTHLLPYRIGVSQRVDLLTD